MHKPKTHHKVSNCITTRQVKKQNKTRVINYQFYSAYVGGPSQYSKTRKRNKVLKKIIGKEKKQSCHYLQIM